MLRSIISGGGSFLEIFLNLIAFLCAILGAIILHECAHGYIAMKNGDYTAKFSGRLTLNPVKHIDLLGGIMFVVAGFGWAKPVPVNPNNFRNQKKGIITVALAGVCTNFIMALLGAGLLALTSYIIGVTDFVLASFGGAILYFFYTLALYGMIINVSLIAFNLIPIFPLDGFRVVEGLTKPYNKYCEWMRRYGMFVLFGIMLLSNLLGMISPYLDIFGMYLSGVRNAIFWLFEKIFGLNLI